MNTRKILFCLWLVGCGDREELAESAGETRVVALLIPSLLQVDPARWKAALAPHAGTKVVTYHRSWSNFAAAFGLDVVGYVEPKPGIPPSPAHILTLIHEMKRQGIKLILVEPYFDLRKVNAIARDTGAKALVLPPSVGGVKQASDYIRLFDYNVDLLVSTVKSLAGR